MKSIRRFRHRISILLALILAPAAFSHADPPKPQAIFDGKTLTGWKGSADSWRVEDGAITGEIPDGKTLSKNEFIFWEGTVHDFDLQAEFRITGLPSANSGIQYRSERLPDGEAKGYQADLDDGAVWLGRVYEERGRALIAERGSRVSIAPDGRRWADVFAKPESFRTVIHKNDWNTYHVRATASHAELWINGVLFSVLDDHQVNAAKFAGQIAIQLHSGRGPSKIQFRNLQLTDLGATEMPVYANVSAPQPPPEDIGAIQAMDADGKPLNLGFETGTLEGWKAEGNAWEGQPIKGDTVRTRKPSEHSNHAGDYWIGGYEKLGDKGTGTLTSASFPAAHPWASYLVGGGKDPQHTRVEVVEEATGKVIQTGAGADLEAMHREVVDLRPYAGKRIFIRLVDNSTSGWGHVNFDDFVFHDKEPNFAASMPAVAKADPMNRAPRQKESPVLWHMEPNPAKPTAVPNAEAQNVMSTMMLTHGFQAELIAAEPEVKQPVAFAFDDRGRIWVAEAYSYPNKQPEGQGKDRIVIFEDVDGDGTYKKRTVFIEGLNLVSGLEVGFGGVWVGAAPQLLFIPDRNHDDIPDGPPEVLLDGWGYQDTHETLNSFTWGPDGWLYGNQGVFTNSLIGKPGAPDSERIPLHSGVWRYHPVRHEFEIFAHGGSNQWGLDYNEAGQLFMTHCRSFWGGGGTTHVIRNGHFWNQSNSNYAPFISNAGADFAPDLRNFLPASAEYDDGEGGAGKPGTTAIYGGHSHVGTMIYLGDNWPDTYRDHLFTNNLFGHQMNHEENVRSGSGYETIHGGYDLLFAPDPKYIAVDLQTGPDGAVYLIDWCDLQHCHNPAPEKWDRTNGRIYRVSWQKTYHPVKVNLGALSDLELAKLQLHHNDWYCRAARQLLQERAAAGKVDPNAVAWLNELAATSQDSSHVLRALWTLHVIGALDSARLTASLQNSSDFVRSWAIQLATEKAGPPLISMDVLALLAKEDPSATVRLALASAMPMLPADACWAVGSALALHEEDAKDRFLPKMVWFGLAPVIEQDFSRGLALAKKTPLPSLADSIRWDAATHPQGRELLVEEMVSAPTAEADRELRILAFGLKNDAGIAAPKAWPQAEARFTAASADAGDHTVANQLAALFGDKAVIASTRTELTDPHRTPAERRAAFDLLKRIGDKASVPLFAGLLDQDEYRTAVIPLLSGSSDPSIAAAILKRINSFNDADRSAALVTLTSRPSLAMALLDAVKAGTFDKKLLTSFHVRQMRNLHDAALDQLLDQAWGKVNDSSEALKPTIARLKKAYEEAPLWAYDAKAGKLVFEQTCAVCHSMNGVGGKLGPDLGGSWRNGLSYFLENIVDPNAVVGEAYQLSVITKRDGSVLSGIVDSETDTAVSIHTLTEAAVVPKSEIKDRQKFAQSLMPPGLLEAMPERKVIELLKFLTSKN